MTLLAALVDTSARVASNTSRRAKIAHLAQFLRSTHGEAGGIAVAYLSGAVRQGKTGIRHAAIRDAMPGAHASTPTVTLLDVDTTLERIATTSGAGSTARRKEMLGELFAHATPNEAQFLARLLVGELRQGALEGLMIDAVAAASGIEAAEVRRAAMAGGGVAAIARVAMEEGVAGLARFKLSLFQALAPMLAQPADDIEDAFARIGGRGAGAAVEWKLDGARVQVHKLGDEVRLYSRTGNDVTPAAPEIVEVARQLPAHAAILDGEAIALTASGAPYPFQETMSRFGRVQDIAAMREKMPLSVFFFDCLRRDDDDLVSLPGSERWRRLVDLMGDRHVTPRIVTSDPGAARRFYEETVARGHEGVMVKAQDAPYDPGARSAAWLKVKRVHTLDLVVLAAEWGHGRRHGYLSNLHLGALDPATGQYVMLGKTFKGMTDAILAWQTEEIGKREVSRDAYTVYARPELVVEVTFNDLQASPRYPGGLALRFARVKGYRPDKRAADADTMDTVRAIYAAQAQASTPAPRQTPR
ncbi:MAG: ATP-dependent DNA ligase [Burkholderiales bacterium]